MISLNQVLLEDYKKWHDREYIFEKKNNKFESITFGEFVDKVTGFAKYLLSKNLKEKNIAIFSKNCIPWMIADIAIMNYVGVSVGLSKEWKFEGVKYAIEKCDIDCLIYSNDMNEIVDKIKEIFSDILYISIEDEFESCIEESSLDLVARDNLVPAKIIFTSGTTSLPKAVTLSLKNIFSGFESLKRRCQFDITDVCYLFLPLSHTYGCIYNFIFSLISGYQIYLASAIMNIESELLEVNPTIFCAVPLIYSKIYMDNKESLKNSFGNNIKYLFSGGAKFTLEIRQAYIESGLNIMEAYALSETSSSLSIDYPNDNDGESVGTIFEDIDVKISNKNEEGIGDILVKGDNVFIGYYNDSELTEKAFTEDGYFITGDLGCIKNNKLYLKGRKDIVLVLDNGENISPKELEDNIMSLNSNISRVKVYIKNKKLSCDLYLKQIDFTNWDEFFKVFNKSIPKYKHIKQYDIYNNNQRIK